MAQQPYTSTQLAFFRNTLKLLESTVFESLLHASEALDAAQANLLKIEQEPIAIVDDTTDEQVSSSFFAVLSEVETTRAADVLITAPSKSTDEKTSAVFFRHLPWQGAEFVVTEDSIIVDKAEESIQAESLPLVTTLSIQFSAPPTVVDEADDSQSSAEFFHELPWQAEAVEVLAAAEEIEEIAIVDDNALPVIESDVDLDRLLDYGFDDDSTPSSIATPSAVVVDIPMPPQQTSAVFFRGLPWQGVGGLAETQQAVAVEPITPPVFESDSDSDMEILLGYGFDDDIITTSVAKPSADVVDLPMPPRQTSTAFFRALPWQDVGGLAETPQAIVVEPIAPPVFESDSDMEILLGYGFDDDIITTSVAKPTTEKLSSSAFFRALPWQDDKVLPLIENTAIAQTVQPTEIDSDLDMLLNYGFVDERLLEPVTESISTPVRPSSAVFFGALPWQGQSNHSAVHDNDFAALSFLATQTALQAAQRVVSRSASASAHTARGFFTTLPW